MPTYTAEEQVANRAKLVAALRSGEYEQGQNYLSEPTPDGALHCCLGVACDISGLGTWDEDTGSIYIIPDPEGEANDTHLPDAVRQWLGFANESGDLHNPIRFEDHYCIGTLIDANDSGMSFDDIATLIEDGDVQLSAA